MASAPRFAGTRQADRVFQGAVTACGVSLLVLLGALVTLLVVYSADSIERFGFSFLFSTNWDPVFERFGAGAFIYGTLVTSAVALVIAIPIAVGGALFISEYSPPWLREPLSFTIELLAVIPSIIYGLWGFFVLAPIMRFEVEPFFKNVLGPLPVVGGLFAGPAIGKDLFVGGVILAIMILPTVVAVSREVLRAVPNDQREGMIALGATKWESIWFGVLPFARGGIAASAMLGLARAFGETMAVTMVIGNASRDITGSLLTPGYTMASAIANQFTEADTEIYFSAIVEVALVLLLVSTVINVAARLIISRMRGVRV
jgi:phosphate transport system permease protein